MPKTAFLYNDALWDTLRKRVEKARLVRSAIAYFSSGGSKLLPLGKGDTLVVDMAISTVRSGATDPAEIGKLMRSGVHVFSRPGLHAKIVIADQTLFAGSANVSKRSRALLDEAALFTTERAAVRKAAEFLSRLCTEPVRPQYLAKCLAAYRPPRTPGAVEGARGLRRRLSHAKLWILNLAAVEPPKAEAALYQASEEKAKRRKSLLSRTELDSFHWPRKPAFAADLHPGDWIIQVVTDDDGSIAVSPPAQLLMVDSYVRNKARGLRRYVFHLEAPERGQLMAWRSFRARVARILKRKLPGRPRTSPVRDAVSADLILGLWTPAGRIAR